METFVIRVFVDDTDGSGGLRGLVEQAGRRPMVFDGPDGLLRIIEGGLAKALRARRLRLVRGRAERGQR